MTIATTATCPKCSYVRGSADAGPEWQCPACGIAYQKYHAYVQRVKAQIAPRQAQDGAPPVAADSSIWSLVLVNVVALVVALALDWRLSDLMAVYWIQSVIIGASYYARIVGLEKFSTENMQVNNRSVEPTPKTKRQIAAFFLMHFGGFHLGYLVFIVSDAPGGFHPDIGLLICAVAFAVNHYFSYRYHRELDRRGTPNIGTLMFTPYIRIVPMHITIVFGAFVLSSAGVLFFGLLKTVADVVMHYVEHRALATTRAN